MIAKLFDKIKSSQYPIFLAICIIAISFISYNLGKISSRDKQSLEIGESANIYKAIELGEDVSISSPVPTKILDLRVVVSKASDTKRYHYSWCASGKKIKPENQLWFNSDKEAEVAGYTLAGNCSK